MTRTRSFVLENATPAQNEVLVVFDVDGVPRNHLLRNSPTIKANLLATPTTISNPAYDPEDPASQELIVNPARAAVEATAFAKAEQEMDA